MTTQQLHDALSHLPEDLIAETDARRSFRPRVIPLRRYAAMAACFAVVLACSLFSVRLLSSGGAKEQAAAQMPLAGITAEDAAAPQAAAIEEEYGSGQAEMDISRESILEDAPAEAAPPANSQNAVSGTGVCTVTSLADGSLRILPDTNAVALNNFLAQLTFDPTRVCNCLAEYRVETGEGSGYEIGLTEGFVRTAQGQCVLTELQLEELRGILQLPEVTP